MFSKSSIRPFFVFAETLLLLFVRRGIIMSRRGLKHSRKVYGLATAQVGVGVAQCLTIIHRREHSQPTKYV